MFGVLITQAHIHYWIKWSRHFSFTAQYTFLVKCRLRLNFSLSLSVCLSLSLSLSLSHSLSLYIYISPRFRHFLALMVEAKVNFSNINKQDSFPNLWFFHISIECNFPISQIQIDFLIICFCRDTLSPDERTRHERRSLQMKRFSKPTAVNENRFLKRK